MKKIATLQISFDRGAGRNNILVRLFSSKSKGVGLSENSANNSPVIEEITDGVTKNNTSLKVNKIINFMSDKGFRLITATPFNLSGDDVGNPYTDYLFEEPK